MPAFQNPVVPSKRKSEAADGPAAKRRQSEIGSSATEEYWMVQWRNPQTRKHKTWDEDGVLQVVGSKATLYDMDAKAVGFGRADLPLSSGKNFSVGGKDLELDRELTKRDFLSGSCFGSSTFSVSTPVEASPIRTSHSAYKAYKPPTVSKPFAQPSRGIPLQPVSLLSTSQSSSQLRNDNTSSEQKDGIWSVAWRKPVNNKNKQTWDGDAYAEKSDDKLTLISEEGKIMGSTSCKGHLLCEGYRMYIGGKEVRFDAVMPRSQLPDAVRERLKDAGDDEDVEVVAAPTPPVVKPQPMKPIAAANFYGAPPKSKEPKPLHDPAAEGAIVMKAPTKDHIKKFNKKGLPVVPVVIDPVLARRLRPHQVEGVKFLYECVMGLRKHEGQGCILADEMGLGKTLQTITLVWTLLKQNPFFGPTPAVQKVLIVCPVSLVNNWKSEFHKWLGRDRVGVTVCDNSNKGLQTFLHGGKHQHVLIIGYERLRTVVNKITTCIPPVGLIICDEGHRLKSANNKTTTMFKALKTPRRVILSGTPIQNDLSEFHAMADFCNPGLLDDYQTFRRVYEVPIVKSRTPEATAKELEIGEGRLAQLLTISNSFVLRRDAGLLGNYLPPKHEHIVFVKPTELQISMYQKILHPDKVDDFVNGSQADTLALLNTLKKVSNSPILVKAAHDKDKESARTSIAKSAVADAVTVLKPDARVDDMTLSGKLILVSKLLKYIYEHTDEKVVFVSHYTSSLNILSAYCDRKRYKYNRLDGDTPPAKRQEYVNQFNKSTQRSNFIFLLSSKAGGVGINLTGASRLILFDCDWNPSYDLQSAARCHRDGQKRPVHVYRLMTAGLIDEKIYQRQVTKLGLSSSLMGSESSKDKSDSFTRKDLRDIFRVYADTGCNTHDLLDCSCEADITPTSPDEEPSDEDESEEEDDEERKGFLPASQVKPKDISKADKADLQKKKAALAALGEFKHINCLGAGAENMSDGVLRSLLYRPPPAEASAPKSQLETLLSLDLATIDAMDASKKFQALPGGTITYVFEKTASTTPEDVPVKDG